MSNQDSRDKVVCTHESIHRFKDKKTRKIICKNCMAVCESAKPSGVDWPLSGREFWYSDEELEEEKEPEKCCPHKESDRFDDDKTGDEVCRACGLVLGPALSLAPLPPLSPLSSSFFGPGDWPSLVKRNKNKLRRKKKTTSDSSPPYQSLSSKDDVEEVEQTLSVGDKSYKKEIRKRDELLQYCTLLNVDNEAVINSAMHVLKRIEEALEWEGKPLTFPRPEHMAYAIWDALSTHLSPRSPKTIADCCGTDAKKMLRLEIHLLKNEHYTEGNNMLSNSNNPPSMYCETACDMLYLPFAITRLVKGLVLHYEDDFQGCRPESVVAAAILLICERVRKLVVYSPNLLKVQAQIIKMDLIVIKNVFPSIAAKKINEIITHMEDIQVVVKDGKMLLTFKNA